MDRDKDPQIASGGRPLYVTDLDGTFLGPDAKVSERSRRLVNKAIAAGADFTIATARTPATVAELLEGIELKNPLVVMTGATLWNPATGEYSRTVFIPEQEARKVVEIYRRMRFSSFVYTLVANKLHIYHIGPISKPERDFMEERSHSPFKTFHVPESGESTLPDRLDNVILFYGMNPAAASAEAHKAVAENVDCTPLFYHDIYGAETAVAEVFAREATKAKGIRRLAEGRRVVAFGDNVNDIPMLLDAQTAVAVENAMPEVKEAADIVIGPNTEDSVARFIAGEAGVDVSSDTDC